MIWELLSIMRIYPAEAAGRVGRGGGRAGAAVGEVKRISDA